MAKIEKPGTCDEVIREVRKIKESLAKAQDFDIRRILDEARERQKNSGRTIIPVPAPTRSLKEVMNEVGARAEARGLTPEILDSLLHDK